MINIVWSSAYSETEMNDSIQTATSLDVNTAIEGFISDFYDEDYYEINLIEDGMIEVLLDVESVEFAYKQWTVKLINEEYEEIYSENIPGHLKISKLPKTGLPAGIYYIVVSNAYVDSDGLSYSLTAKYTVTDNWEKEFNENIKTASGMNLNASYNGLIVANDDKDYYKITLPEDGMIEVAFEHEVIDCESSGWRVKLADEANNEFYTHSVAGDEKISRAPKTGLPAGTYYISVETGYEYSDMVYSITANYTQSNNWEKEFNENGANAAEMKLNEIYNGLIVSSEDTDYYKISLLKNGVLDIVFEHDVFESDWSQWNIKLLNDEYEELFSKEIYSSVKKTCLPSVGLPAGVYYVVVDDGYGSSDIQYSITANYTESDNWEKEFNENSLTASEIILNDRYCGSVAEYSDRDFYRITLPSDGMIEIVFAHEVFDADCSQWTVKLMDEEYEEFYSKEIYSKTKQTILPSIGLPAGCYYIVVESGYEHTDLTYSITANYTESDNWEKEFNETSETASPVDFNTEYSGSVAEFSDKDFYKITLPSDGMIEVVFNHDVFEGDWSHWTVKLMDEEYKEFYNKEVFSDTKKTIMPSIGLPAGCYYIVVESGYTHTDITYSITANYTESDNWEKEFNHESNLATEIDINKLYYGSIAMDGDKDCYQIYIDKEEQIKIEFDHNNSDDNYFSWKIRLLDVTFNEIKSFSISASNDANEFDLGILPFGDYFIEISNGYEFSDSVYKFAVSNKNHLQGDMNGDGKITASDARTVLRYSAKIEIPDENQAKIADVNSDGRITASDARKILRVSAKIETM